MTTPTKRHMERKSNRLRDSLRLILRRYFAQLRKRPALTAGAVLLPAVGEILIFYVPPLLIARLLAAFARHQHFTTGELAPYVLELAGLWLTGEAAWRFAVACIMRVEVRGIESLYIEALDELLGRDLVFFHNNYAGSLTKRALSYARRFEDFCDVLSFQVATTILPLAFVAVILWTYSPWLIVALVGLLAAAVAMVVPLIRRRRVLVDIREAASNVLAGHVADSILNAESVRAFAREPDEASIHAHNVGDYGAKVLKSWDYQNMRVDMVTAPMFVLTNAAGLIVALWVGSRGGSTLEVVFITFSYYATATHVLWEFNRIYRNLEGALTEAAQFTELLLDPPTVTDAEITEVFAPADFGLELRGVKFRHSDSQPFLFDGFSLRIEPGAKIGLVGRSGGGKTSLTRLLLRFSDVEAGDVLIGGQSIRSVSQAALRKSIAYVPQDPSMFHRSIADNIRVGRPEATDAEVRRAARLAHAAEFIEALPGGYETLVGERGVKLSGGQRQRVAIARAILKDAPILILDEATSSLDSESEALIQDALWTLLRERTALVIAHRLSTVRRMDELIILETGSILERGSHEDLLARGGTYAMLWAHQSGGFLVDNSAGLRD